MENLGLVESLKSLDWKKKQEIRIEEVRNEKRSSVGTLLENGRLKSTSGFPLE